MRIFGYTRKSNYNKDGSCHTCPFCGSKDIADEVIDHIDGYLSPACEIEYSCNECGNNVAYWSYGSFDPYFAMGDRSIPALIWRIKNDIRHSWDQFLKDVDLREDPLRRYNNENPSITW